MWRKWKSLYKDTTLHTSITQNESVLRMSSRRFVGARRAGTAGDQLISALGGHNPCCAQKAALWAADRDEKCIPEGGSDVTTRLGTAHK